MSTQSQLAFLRWTKQTHPAVYQRALQRARARTGLAGLGDDLLQPITVDDSNLQLSSDTAALSDAAASSGSSISDVINSIAGAISSVAPSIVNTQAQLSTIQLNAQRARAGQPPISSTSLLTGIGLGSVGGIGLLALAAGAGFLLLAKRRS